MSSQNTAKGQFNVCLHSFDYIVSGSNMFSELIQNNMAGHDHGLRCHLKICLGLREATKNVSKETKFQIMISNIQSTTSKTNNILCNETQLPFI